MLLQRAPLFVVRSAEAGVSETKTCPQCAEEVNEAARICRFCRYNFETGLTGEVAVATAPQAPPSPAYQPGYPPPPPVQASKTNGLAIASLVLGILWLYWIGSILAVIFGHVALGQIGRSGGLQTGRGMAIAGLVLGWVGVGVLILLIVIGAGISVSGGSS